MSEPLPPWRRALQATFVGVVFATILVEWAGYVAHVSRLSYALAVPVLAGVLAALPGRNADPRGPGPRDQSWATALLLSAALMLAAGSLAGIFTLSVFAFPLAVLGLALAWWGIDAVRHRSWGAVLLFLMVPVPMPLLDSINPLLTRASGTVAVTLVRPFDPEATWKASELVFRGWTLVVAEACSGSGTFLTYLVLAVFLAGLFRPGPVVVAGLFLLAVPLTLAVNGLRIASTALLLDHLGPGAAEGWAHELLGLTLVIGAAGLLALVVALLSKDRKGGA